MVASSVRDRRSLRVAALLALAVGGTFLPVLANDWVDLDDGENYLANPYYRGLGWAQVAWAWRTYWMGVYQPLGWLALAAEYAASGMGAGGYHLASLLFHVGNALVLYALLVALLARRGGDPGDVHVSAGLAAALFAVHPLRVQVVAWVSAQSYLPCAFFAILTVIAYLRACERSDPPGLAVAFGLFLMALLFKAEAVSLPFVLLILDYYPLRRLGTRRAWLEKVPFFALDGVFMVLAFLAKREISAVVPFERYGMASRVAQACYGIGYYLAKTVAPLDLTAYHPLPERLELTDWPNLARALAVVVASVALVALRRRWPGLLAAWAAFLVMLAPNLGLVRLTSGLVSDRYSYLASMSLAALAAAGIWQLRRWNRAATTAVALLAIGALSALSWLQCRTWHDSVALWTHAIAHGEARSPLIRNNLGSALARRGRVDEAIAQYEEAVRQSPGYSKARFNLATALIRLGRAPEAVGQYRELLRREPGHAEARYNLGLTLARLGRFEEAAGELAEAARRRPDHAEVFHNWGLALAQLGRDEEAVARYREALRLRPDYPAARRHLDDALARLGKGG